jgi:KUP system potassium uptake protein
VGWALGRPRTPDPNPSFFPVAPRAAAGTASGMPRWQDRLFMALVRSANDATDYLQIPTDRVVEVGTQVTI